MTFYLLIDEVAVVEAARLEGNLGPGSADQRIALQGTAAPCGNSGASQGKKESSRLKLHDVFRF
jgi:hypothetical protein